MRLFEADEFRPGTVLWDNLDQLDPDRPLHEQESLVGCEDVLAVKFPNAVLLDVSYHNRSDVAESSFVVSVVPAASEWTPIRQQRCKTIAELRNAVVELMPVARDWTA